MHCLSRTPRSYLVNSYSDVKENDEIKRESYEATWLDMVMETRPEHKYVSPFSLFFMKEVSMDNKNN